jgi:hypothetical protein
LKANSSWIEGNPYNLCVTRRSGAYGLIIRGLGAPTAIARFHGQYAIKTTEYRFQTPETTTTQSDGFKFAKLLIFHSFSFLVVS